MTPLILKIPGNIARAQGVEEKTPRFKASKVPARIPPMLNDNDNIDCFNASMNLLGFARE